MRLFKIFLLLTYCFFFNKSYSQNYSKDWQGFFSYLNIKDIAEGENIIYGAAENAIFSYDTTTGDTEKLTTVQGLSGETISSISYSSDKGLLVIGFENGLLQVYEESNKEFITVVDIIEKTSIPVTKKRINHINIFSSNAYISTNYGISVYNLNKREFKDTYFIGDGGAQTEVNQTAVLDDYIYTALPSGIKKAEVSNPNLVDYNQWETIDNSNWLSLTSFNNKIYAVSSTNELFEIENDTIEFKVKYDIPFKKIKSIASSNLLSIVTTEEAFLYDNNLDEVAYIKTSEDLDTDFTSISFDNNYIYIGTTETRDLGISGLGVLKIPRNNLSSTNKISPTSPLSNNIFKITVKNGQIWETYGGYSSAYGWEGGTRKSGYSHFKDDTWTNTNYSELEKNIENPWFLTFVAVNPFDLTDVYISSYFSGVINIKNNQIQTLYNKENSTLIPFIPGGYLVNASFFDENGAFWVTNARVDNSLNKFENGEWETINLNSIIPIAENNNGFSSITKNDENYLYLGTSNYGIIGYDINNNKLVNISGKEQGLPSDIVSQITIDQKKNVWVGTYKGLRVMYNQNEFFNNPNYKLENIVIEEDGVAKELLYQQTITDIVVDGSNNKWISTLSTGVFFLTEDGQKTIAHFTTNNSPLPTNDVLDLEFDETTGLIYMSTNKGLVSFNSGSSIAKKTLDEAFIYPNPVRPTFNIATDKIKIKNISENANIKITDITGNLVAEAQTRINQKYKGFNLEIDGGTAFWNGKNLVGTTIASGVYIVLISDLDSEETKTLKIMVIR